MLTDLSMNVTTCTTQLEQMAVFWMYRTWNVLLKGFFHRFRSSNSCNRSTVRDYDYDIFSVFSAGAGFLGLWRLIGGGKLGCPFIVGLENAAWSAQNCLRKSVTLVFNLWLKQAFVDSNWTNFLPKADLMLNMNHIKTSVKCLRPVWLSSVYFFQRKRRDKTLYLRLR